MAQLMIFLAVCSTFTVSLGGTVTTCVRCCDALGCNVVCL